MQDVDAFELDYSNEDIVSDVDTSTSDESKAMKLYLYFLLMFQTFFRLSDNALRVLLTFFAKFLGILGQIFQCEQLVVFVSKLPRTVGQARANAGGRDNFRKCVCCPRCFAIYLWDEKLEPQTLTCTHIQFPEHPQVQHRQPCGKTLFKKVKTNGGKIIHQPISIHCYKIVVESLQSTV